VHRNHRIFGSTFCSQGASPHPRAPSQRRPSIVCVCVQRAPYFGALAIEPVDSGTRYHVSVARRRNISGCAVKLRAEPIECRFPVGATYVVEGVGGAEGHLRGIARYVVLPGGRRINISALWLVGPAPPLKELANQRYAVPAETIPMTSTSLGELLDPDKWIASGKNLADFPWPDGANEREAMKLILCARPMVNAHVERWSKLIMKTLGRRGGENVGDVFVEEYLRELWERTRLYLASGVAPIPEMLQAGVTVGLASDGAASSNNHSLFQAMKFAALMQKGLHGDPTIITAQQVLRMATISGARAIGLGDEIGSIEVGKKADLVLLDITDFFVSPIHDPISAIVYSALGHEPTLVVIDGRIVMRDRKVLTVDERRVRPETQKAAAALTTGPISPVEPSSGATL
jgi:Amidohydrolase family